MKNTHTTVTVKISEEFKNDYITRAAGERLREMIVSAKAKNIKIEIDFSGVTVGSTSFFDEGFAKLALENWTSEMAQENIILKGQNRFDHKVMVQVCKYRGIQISR